MMLAVLAASAVVGVLRGLAFELLSLAGWIVAWVCAKAWALPLAERLHIGSPGSALQQGAGLLICFLGVLVGWRLVSWLIQQVIQATPLAPLDRALGAVFGLLRGALILLVLVLGFGLTPLRASEGWQASTGVRWSQGVLTVVGPVVGPVGGPAAAASPPSRPAR
ncbi:MAG TPA: CvpA family protein [Burkholderiaceae bacterium]|nr:CvpA family protein [Burkholderiaceae bacterium]HMZ00557.1 CvpA family protein [Burkholderiaceae bacterium]HNB46836.1 CvpA family protein [Burkholderiaceae bacterium]